MEELFADPDPERARRAMEAMLKMRKLDIAALRSAADGGSRRPDGLGENPFAALAYFSGEGGIRTLEAGIARPRDFQSRSLSRSDTSPEAKSVASAPPVLGPPWACRRRLLGERPEVWRLFDQRQDRVRARHPEDLARRVVLRAHDRSAKPPS